MRLKNFLKTFDLMFATMLTVLMFLTPVPSMAASQAEVLGAQFALNHNSGAQKYQLGNLVTRDKMWVQVGQYSFAKQGGAIGTVLLRNVGSSTAGIKIPAGSVVKDCAIVVDTTVTSGGSATLAFSTGQTAADLKAATAYTSFTAGSVVACVPVGTAATSIAMTADSTMSMTIATAAVTAGVIRVYVQFWPPVGSL